MLKTSPAVFAVEDTYQIMVAVSKESLFSVKIGDKEYFDESNGIMRSNCDIHRACVPKAELERAGGYTVCVRPLIERKPYFTQTAPLEEFTFDFYPVPEKNARAYHISDAHNRIEQPVRAAKAFGKIDFLILNGDVIDHSGDPSKFDNVYEICCQLTGGNIPVVFSRGNHDMRGNFAEKFAEYTPNHLGNTYYTFRLGSIWGIVLDCGEDKNDTSSEYGFTVSCHAFRERQTSFLNSVIKNAKNTYNAQGVNKRVVIAHNPFTHQLQPPFNIETEIFSQWGRLLKENVKPDVMVCGHLHCTKIFIPGDETDHLGHPCKIVIGADIKSDRYIGCGYEFGEETTVTFTDSNGQTLEKHTI